MRIDELRLLAFGPFTDRHLRFNQGTEGVHVVFGANEAGKSSALRAIGDSLFGIPMRSQDDFRHPYASMRIGFSLRSAAGDRVAATRLKKRTVALIDAETESPIAEATLQRFLSGVDRQAFERMFGLDQDTLRAGGREIAMMQGDVGATLFSAAGGLVHLRAHRDALDREAAEIYRPKAPTKPLKVAVAALDALKAQAKEDRRSSKDYREKNEQLAVAKAQAEDLSRRLRDCRRTRSLLERMMRSVPLIDQLRALREEVAKLAGTHILRTGFAEDVRRASDAVLAADTRLKGARQAVATIEQELGALPPPRIAEEQWPLAQRLSNALGAHRKATADLPGLRREDRSRRAELGPRIERLRPGLTLEDYARLFISPVDRGRITSIGRKLTTASANEVSTQESLGKAAKASRAAEAQLASLPEPVDTCVMEEALKAARAKGDIESEREERRRRCDAERETLRRELARAGRWQGTPDQLRDIPLPTSSTIDVHEVAIARAETKLSRARETHEKLIADRSRLNGELAALRAAEGELPTEQDVAAARGERNRLWSSIRECWLDRRDELRDGAGHAADPRDLPAAGNGYERLVVAADDVVDRVRREHARVAQRARLESEVGRHDSEIVKAAQAVQVAEAELASAESAWGKVWEPLSVVAGTPREMREWLSAIGTIRTRREALDEADRVLADLDVFIARRTREIGSALEAVGLFARDEEEGATLGRLVARCDEFVKEQAELRTRRTSLENTRNQALQREEELASELEARRREMADVKGEWETALASAGVPGQSDTTAADTWMTESMDVHSQAHQLLGPDGSTTRIAHIERDQRAFLDQVADVLRKLCDDTRQPTLDTVEDIATNVLDSIAQAKVRAAAIADAEKRHRTAVAEENRQRTEAAAARAKITALEQEAGVDAGADLGELCKRSDLLRDVLARTKGIEDALRQQAEGEALEQWETRVSDALKDDLHQRFTDTEGEEESLTAEKTTVDQRVGGLRKELEAIGTGATAAAMNAQIQQKLAEIESHARDYVRLWISSRVLRQAVDAYREQNQGEVLLVAGDYFAKLTEGAFSGLTIDSIDDTPVIAGRRRGDPTPVHVDGMSEGTTDQLFLAIRLAYLDIRVRQHEPLPLILDDVLATYDDARAAATLKALAEVSKKTQVILFTHHRHLLTIAEQSVPAGSLFVQDLSA